MARHDAATRAFMEKVAGDDSLEPLRAPKQASVSAQSAASIVTAELEKGAGISPIKIFHLLNEHHKNEWWDWEPETVWRTLEVEHGIASGPEIRNLVMALQTTLRTNAPFEHWHIFEKVGHAFTTGQVDFQVVQPLEIEDCSKTLFVLRILRPKQEFEPEVWGYIAARAVDEGIVFLPADLFGPAQGYLAKLQKDHSGVGREVAGIWPRSTPEDASPAAKNQLAVLHEISAHVRTLEG